MKRTNKKDILLIIITLLAALVFILIFSYSTSPFYTYYFGSDSAQFQTIGKYWAKGMIPYRDLFDHKGPFIFWVNMLSYSIFGGKTGLVILQIVSLFVTLFSMCLIFTNYCKKKPLVVIFLLLCIGVITANFTGGNITEEYCLPFLAVSLYFQLPYLEGNEENYQWWKAVIYGLSFGVCFFTRFTNGISVCCGVFVICILIIRKRRWFDLLINGLSFIGGFSIVAVPFCIYFYSKGLLYEMMFSTFLYNYVYSGKVESWVRNCNGETLFSFFKLYFLFYSLGISLLIAFFQKKYTLFNYLLLTCLMGAYVYSSVYLSPQYPMVMFPNIAILLGLVAKMLENRAKFAKATTAIVLILMLAVTYYSAEEIPGQISRNYNVGKTNAREYDGLMSEVPEEEYDRFAVFCNGVIKDFYLLHDIPPIYKFVVCQEWHAHNSEKTAQEVYETFDSCKAKWILECGESTAIQGVLDNRYRIADVSEGAQATYILYQLVE